MLNFKKYRTLFSLPQKGRIKPVFFLFLFLVSLNIQAQINLVPNPSFEEYYSCPTGNDLGNFQLELAKGWWKPTLGTSDYFNACNTNIVSVPVNFWGFQNAFNGQAYVGLGAAWDINDNYLGFEYIECKLIEPLTPCTPYYFRMWVCLAEEATHAVGKLGAYFSTEKIQSNSFNQLYFNPQIKKNVVISDSTNWSLIDGVFIANGNEQYLTIGYFESNVKDDTVFIQDYGVNVYASYYFIDSISLIAFGSIDESCDFINIPNVFTPNLDGINDLIDVSDYKNFNPEMSIINRWGEEVALLTLLNPTWDGKFKNKNCVDGLYFYKFIYSVSNKEHSKTGFIHLIR